MTRVSADFAGIPGQEMLTYYESFASGGFGAVISEGIYTDRFFSQAYPNQPGLVSSEQVQAWKLITDKVHSHTGVMIAQLMHAGAISQMLKHTKAPSRIVPLGKKLENYGGGGGPFPIPDAMTPDDIRQVIAGYTEAAVNAVKAGFDGVELHAANGYLLDQFVTPYLNIRDDQYGGNVKNRLRIITEIVNEIRAIVPQDFIVGLRISEGKVNNLNYRWEEGSAMAKAILNEIRSLPIDYLHIAAEHWGWELECRYDDGTTITSLAKQMLSIPVIANGKMHRLELAGQLLQNNEADFFAIGKYALSNPDFVQKVRTGQDLKPFDSNTLSSNPSLFTDEKHRLFLESFQEALPQAG
jgi:2,4-dienoyl-CoA reductase-like NADH-dependent reductase (Old Yellow Enzyme family)